MRKVRKKIGGICLFAICFYFLFEALKPKVKSNTTDLVWVVDSMTKVNEKTEENLNQILKDKGYDYKISFRCIDFFADDKGDPISKIEDLKQEQVDILCIPVNKSDYSGHSVGLEMVNNPYLEIIRAISFILQPYLCSSLVWRFMLAVRQKNPMR